MHYVFYTWLYKINSLGPLSIRGREAGLQKEPIHDSSDGMGITMNLLSIVMPMARRAGAPPPCPGADRGQRMASAAPELRQGWAMPEAPACTGMPQR
jgi:hypothetical protein